MTKLNTRFLTGMSNTSVKYAQNVDTDIFLKIDTLKGTHVLVNICVGFAADESQLLERNLLFLALCRMLQAIGDTLRWSSLI
jgi:hypothetical protein